MTTYLLIGQIKGAKSITMKSGGSEKGFTEVTIQYEDFDINGELVLDTDRILFELSLLQDFKDKRNKFISIPMRYLQTGKGTFIFRDENMPYTIFENYPLAPINQQNKK